MLLIILDIIIEEFFKAKKKCEKINGKWLHDYLFRPLPIEKEKNE